MVPHYNMIPIVRMAFSAQLKSRMVHVHHEMLSDICAFIDSKQTLPQEDQAPIAPSKLESINTTLTECEQDLSSSTAPTYIQQLNSKLDDIMKTLTEHEQKLSSIVHYSSDYAPYPFPMTYNIHPDPLTHPTTSNIQNKRKKLDP